MSRSRILSSIAAATVGIALLGACSADSLTERAAAFGLEQAVDGDQDIDLDFNQDGGGFSISTEEGDFALNFDEDNGGIVFNTDEGDGVISFDEDGIVFNTDEGDGVVSFNEDGITLDSDLGDAALNFDDNGDFTIETEDGDLGIFTSQEPPPGWPASVGVPATLVEGTEIYTVLDLGDQIMTTAVFTHDPNEAYGAAVVSALESSGWTVNIFSDQGGGLYAQLQSGESSIIQVVSDSSGNTTVTVAVPG